MAQNQKQNQTYFTNVKKYEISAKLEVYNRATGENEKVFITGTTRGAAALFESIANSHYKTANIKDIKTKELDNGVKVVESFDFGKKGDARNFNVRVRGINIKWHTVDKETGEKSKNYVTKLLLYRRNDEKDKKVHWGKTPEEEKIIMKQIEGLIQALKNKDSKEVRIGIKFVKGKEGKRTYVGYIGTPKTPEKEKQNIEKKEEAKSQNITEKKKPKPADVDVPF